MGDRPVEGCNPWKIKCAQNPKEEYHGTQEMVVHWSQTDPVATKIILKIRLIEKKIT